MSRAVCRPGPIRARRLAVLTRRAAGVHIVSMRADERAAGAIIVVSPEELRDLVRTAVREALSAGRPAAEPSEWLDAAGAAALLGVHRRTVTNLVKRGRLPASRVGRLLRIRRADVLAVLERGIDG